MNADQPVIGIDGNDRVFAAWSKANAAGPNADAYASRYSSGTGWNEATFIGDSDLGMVTSLHSAVSADGSVFAVWYKVGTGHDNIYANRYVPGTGWGSPEALTGAITILDLQITADADGRQCDRHLGTA